MHTLFIFFFNVLHESECVSCVCVVKLMLCPTIKYWLATPLVLLLQLCCVVYYCMYVSAKEERPWLIGGV